MCYSGSVNNEFNFLIGPWTFAHTDGDLFFGGEDLIQIAGCVRWPDVLVMAGVFNSKGQAKKNGWDKPIPFGFTDERIGKRKVRITVLKIY